ncbi:hypothetical protein AAFF_G00091910 [Aldrovandia affinis]|uniref:Uncharacterized protein n=1 Tax=Aldrovandia affinis TaxID=143900 RepID=A0AAD7T2H9_9TELE|nr:hypothetical protein AAFF_G00091910 [Aldrovandia affinis]
MENLLRQLVDTTLPQQQTTQQVKEGMNHLIEELVQQRTHAAQHSRLPNPSSQAQDLLMKITEDDDDEHTGCRDVIEMIDRLCLGMMAETKQAKLRIGISLFKPRRWCQLFSI